MDKPSTLDQPRSTRKGEELNQGALETYLKDLWGAEVQIEEVQQFPSGYSNLTYLIKLQDRELVLRRPPLGANIKSAHDMAREYQVLKALEPVYKLIPRAVAFCEDREVIGDQFYLMERLTGVILRHQLPQTLKENPLLMNKVSLQCVHNLALLHNLTLTPALMDLGKPEGYAQRQIEGWSKRYRNCADRQVPGMEQAMEWLQEHIPSDQEAFIHNDYKYDNLMLDADTWDIKAVLDWEMATVGHPLMDLGTTLAYWAEPQDHPALQPFSLTGHPGNLHRQEVAEQYFQQRKKAMPDVLPFYVFGCFKIGVIVQQIYARYLQGKTQDPRFANLHYVVAAFGQNIENALTYNRINNFY